MEYYGKLVRERLCGRESNSEFSEHEAGVFTSQPVHLDESVRHTRKYICTRTTCWRACAHAHAHAYEHDASNLESETQIVHGPSDRIEISGWSYVISSNKEGILFEINHYIKNVQCF